MTADAAPGRLKVLCWNVLLGNEDVAGIAAVIEAEAPDICLFQELSERHLDMLRRIPDCHVSFAQDFLERGEASCLGIVSRQPFSDERIVDHNAGREVSESIAGRHFGWVENLQSQSVEIVFGDASIRVVNAHLPAAVGPSVRARALNDLRSHFDGDAHVILGGDMNSWSAPLLNLTIGWLLGCGPRDLFRRDREILQSFAAENGLDTVFGDVVTFPRFGLHLDHVFVRGLNAVSARVETGRTGSDHRPLVVEIAIPVAQRRSRDAVAGSEEQP